MLIEMAYNSIYFYAGPWTDRFLYWTLYHPFLASKLSTYWPDMPPIQINCYKIGCRSYCYGKTPSKPLFKSTSLDYHHSFK